MRYITLTATLLALVSLVACTPPSNTATQTIVTNTVPVSSVPPTITTTTPQTSVGDAEEEARIRDLVQTFGKQLQEVSLLAPDAAQEIQNQYSAFVSPLLLDKWMNDVSKAPGRMVSSPWPDHIEISTLTKEGSDRYLITGQLIEVTSTEIVNGGAAAKIPVYLVVQKAQGSWLITDFEEEQ